MKKDNSINKSSQESSAKIISFNYEDSLVRVVTLDKGEPGFVATDVAKVLEHSDVSMMVRNLDDDEYLSQTLFVSGQNRNVIILLESGLYTVIIRSNKPQAKPFRRWVTHEVLPAIRKTGAYSLTPAQPLTLLLPPDFDSEVKKAVGIARIFGFRGNQAYLSANRMIIKLYGIDCIDLMEHKALICEKQERHLTPTEIGKILGGISARKVNKRLAEAGIIESYRDGKNRPCWKATEKGRKYTVLKDTAKKHTAGTPIQQMFFLESVISILKDSLPQ